MFQAMCHVCFHCCYTTDLQPNQTSLHIQVKLLSSIFISIYTSHIITYRNSLYKYIEYIFVFTPLFKKVSSAVQPMLLELNTNERADVEVSTGKHTESHRLLHPKHNISVVGLHLQKLPQLHHKLVRLSLSLFCPLSVSLIVELSDVPLMRTRGAGGSQESKVQQTWCGLSPEQPPENVRYRSI